MAKTRTQTVVTVISKISERAVEGGAALVVDVTLAHRCDGQPAVTEFQVALNEDLKVTVH